MDLIYAKVYTVFYQKATNLFDRHSIWLWYIDIIYLQIVMYCQRKETDKGTRATNPGYCKGKLEWGSNKER